MNRRKTSKRQPGIGRIFKRAVVIAALWGLPVSLYSSLTSLHTRLPRIRTLAELRSPALERLPKPQVRNADPTGPLPGVLGRPWLGSIHDGRLEAVFSDSRWFEPGTAELTAPGRAAVAAILDSVRQLQLDSGRVRIGIASGADPRPVVTMKKLYASNWELSAARATAVVRQLESHGVDPALLTGTGLGHSRGRSLWRKTVVTLEFTPVPKSGPASPTLEVAQR
jgi:hypothetical protein